MSVTNIWIITWVGSSRCLNRSWRTPRTKKIASRRYNSGSQFQHSTKYRLMWKSTPKTTSLARMGQKLFPGCSRICAPFNKMMTIKKTELQMLQPNAFKSFSKTILNSFKLWSSTSPKTQSTTKAGSTDKLASEPSHLSSLELMIKGNSNSSMRPCCNLLPFWTISQRLSNTQQSSPSIWSLKNAHRVSYITKISLISSSLLWESLGYPLAFWAMGAKSLTTCAKSVNKPARPTSPT